MLSKKMQDALNDQANYEAFASSAYLAMAAWCESQGMAGCAFFFFEQSAEETTHYLKMLKYVIEAGGTAEVQTINGPQATFKSILDAFETAMGHEKEVTKRINKLMTQAVGEKDYATQNFLQWYVEEQLEEENLFQGILDKFKLMGKEKPNLLILDQAVARIKAPK
jgi:ferritin